MAEFGEDCSDQDAMYILNEMLRQGLITVMNDMVTQRPQGAVKLPPNQNPNMKN